MNNGKMLVLNDLNVWYTPGKPVLEKLSMELGTNEVIGLIGLNGAEQVLQEPFLKMRRLKPS